MGEEYIHLRGKRGRILVRYGYGCRIKVNFILKIDMQGLAMTRSFGDNISKSVGVTHKP